MARAAPLRSLEWWWWGGERRYRSMVSAVQKAHPQPGDRDWRELRSKRALRGAGGGGGAPGAGPAAAGKQHGRSGRKEGGRGTRPGAQRGRPRRTTPGRATRRRLGLSSVRAHTRGAQRRAAGLRCRCGGGGALMGRRRCASPHASNSRVARREGQGGTNRLIGRNDDIPS
ncbi:MAG: hypothetical protein J3K34DRAFT_434838 [Monoraphidium minutum]|nr:MAG: hypothetical protein J3K34DRAFT_434838 [Monoraphidium minutum]